MNIDTGQVYTTREEVLAAQKRGERLRRLTPMVAALGLAAGAVAPMKPRKKVHPRHDAYLVGAWRPEKA
jgi:hypothetical protein